MSTIREQYASHVAAGEIERDPAQETVVARLDAINARLATHRLARKSSSLGWLFSRRETSGPSPESRRSMASQRWS